MQLRLGRHEMHGIIFAHIEMQQPIKAFSHFLDILDAGHSPVPPPPSKPRPPPKRALPKRVPPKRPHRLRGVHTFYSKAKALVAYRSALAFEAVSLFR